jgi:hypothetical protein
VNVDSIARLITLFFDALVLPFGEHRAAALVALSIGSGAVFALVFRATSQPEPIRRARKRFQARVLEMRLYPDDVVLLVRALGGALVTQLEYFRAAAKPIVILAVLALPSFFQIEARFAGRPLHANERTLVTATLKPGLDPRAVPATLGSTDGLAVDPRPVRVRATREIVWRVEAKDAGEHELTARVYDKDYRFPLRANSGGRALGRERRADGGWDSFVHAGLPSIPDDSAIESIRVAYPDASYRVLGARLGWLSVFLAGSLLGAVVPAWILRIQM